MIQLPGKLENLDIATVLQLCEKLKRAQTDYAEHQRIKRKLTAAGFKAEVLKKSGSTEKRLREVQEKCNSRPELVTPDRVFRFMSKCLETNSFGEVSFASRHLHYFLRCGNRHEDGVEVATAEMAILGSNVMELVALGYLLAAERLPDSCFGTIDDMSLHDARGRGLALLRDNIRAELEIAVKTFSEILEAIDTALAGADVKTVMQRQREHIAELEASVERLSKENQQMTKDLTAA